MTTGSRYTDEQRREAVACYLLHGNWRRVAEITGIPQRTLNEWGAAPWFATMLAELRAEKGSELDGAYTRIIHEAVEQLLDRLKNGDPVLVAGQIKRKPVSARDLALVSAITYDKRALARNQPRASQEADYTLEELAKYLEWSARGKDQQEGRNIRS